MITIQTHSGLSNPGAMLLMYDFVRHGVESEARGQKTRNVRNLAIVLDASQPVITSFNARKLNLGYCKKEWLWYLGANKFDDSIEQHATMWKKLKQADGSYHSNYGQYMFAENMADSQFWYCMRQLITDPGSRRASMVLLNQGHLYQDNTDTVCTYAINFTIEGGRLHMSVMMRSNDVIFGFTNDSFCFHQLYLFAYAILSANHLGLLHGTYTHFTNSMHVYERHFEMIEQLANIGMAGHYQVDVPKVSAPEAIQLIRNRGQSIGVAALGPYTKWLTE